MARMNIEEKRAREAQMMAQFRRMISGAATKKK